MCPSRSLLYTYNVNEMQCTMSMSDVRLKGIPWYTVHVHVVRHVSLWRMQNSAWYRILCQQYLVLFTKFPVPFYVPRFQPHASAVPLWAWLCSCAPSRVPQPSLSDLHSSRLMSPLHALLLYRFESWMCVWSSPTSRPRPYVMYMHTTALHAPQTIDRLDHTLSRSRSLRIAQLHARIWGTGDAIASKDSKPTFSKETELS